MHKEILDRLQNHTKPQGFTPKAVYDGKAILFASHQLRLRRSSWTVHGDHVRQTSSWCSHATWHIQCQALSCAAAQTIDFSQGFKYLHKTTILDELLLRALTDLINERVVSSPCTLTTINLLQLLIWAAPNLWANLVFNLYIRSLSARMYPHNLWAYYTDAGKEPVGGGLKLWRGFFQSVNLFFYHHITS